jgi:hypothetical protein
MVDILKITANSYILIFVVCIVLLKRNIFNFVLVPSAFYFTLKRPPSYPGLNRLPPDVGRLVRHSIAARDATDFAAVGSEEGQADDGQPGSFHTFPSGVAIVTFLPRHQDCQTV